MHDLFPPAVTAEAFRSARLRVVQVVGDGMAPTLRPHFDFALCKPVDRYQGEGIYLLADCLGGQDFFRVDGVLDAGEPRVRLMRDNPLYPMKIVAKAQFEEAVLAFVVADIKVRDHRFLRDLSDGGEEGLLKPEGSNHG